MVLTIEDIVVQNLKKKISPTKYLNNISGDNYIAYT